LRNLLLLLVESMFPGLDGGRRGNMEIFASLEVGFFLWYWDLNLGSGACYAGPLYLQPFFALVIF
jgi:drug/metabolite transporter (DMT)-like permease